MQLPFQGVSPSRCASASSTSSVSTRSSIRDEPHHSHNQDVAFEHQSTEILRLFPVGRLAEINQALVRPISQAASFGCVNDDANDNEFGWLDLKGQD